MTKDEELKMSKEIGLNAGGATFWRLQKCEDTFTLSLFGDAKEYFLDPRITEDYKTMGQAQRELLHERLDEFINAYIKTGNGMGENK